MEQPQLLHLAHIRSINIGGIKEGRDLVHLFSETQGQLPWHGPGEAQTELTTRCDVDLGKVGITFRNLNGETFRMYRGPGVTLPAVEDGVGEAPVDRSVGEVVVHELSPLHQHERCSSKI